jgi:hypothetical protein
MQKIRERQPLSRQAENNPSTTQHSNDQNYLQLNGNDNGMPTVSIELLNKYAFDSEKHDKDRLAILL